MLQNTQLKIIYILLLKNKPDTAIIFMKYFITWYEEKNPLVKQYKNINSSNKAIGFSDPVYTLDMYSTISRAIPIKVMFGNKNDTNYSIVYVWYIANKEFANKLPERYKYKIAKELEYVNLIENGSITVEEACKGLDDESYFNICTMKSAITEISSTYPNPTKDILNIEYISYEDRQISIYLTDISGNLSLELKKMSPVSVGKHSLSAEMNSLKSGVYMLTIETDKGERISKKILVQN